MIADDRDDETDARTSDGAAPDHDHRRDSDHAMSQDSPIDARETAAGPRTAADDAHGANGATDVPEAFDVPGAEGAGPEGAGPDGGGGDDGVAIRTLVVGGLPLLVAGIGDVGRGPQLRAALEERGVMAMAGFMGAELPRGAKVGFMLGTADLRLVDDRDDTLLRAARKGLDADWLAAARRLKGTMTVVVRGASPTPELAPAELAALIDECARHGDAWGAIVGFAEERMTLPLMF
jgi:hypothetical protein